MNFFEHLESIFVDSKSRLIVGVDYHLKELNRFFEGELEKGFESFVKNSMDQILQVCSDHNLRVLKFQSAFFEERGIEGFSALKWALAEARSQGFISILDNKRADIGSTMAAYARSSFEYFDADCVTVTPYLGLAALDCFDDYFSAGKGAYVVWVSSNPGAGIIQDAAARNILGELDEKTKWRGSVGLVAGATKVGENRDLFLEAANSYPLLLPGVGAQGATLLDVKEILDISPGSAFPVSRAALGFGQNSAEFLAIKDWNQYAEFIRNGLKSLL